MITASAAGLVSNVTAGPYAVAKASAVAFAEWLAINYGDSGVKVSCLCPQGVDTRMLEADDPLMAFLRKGALSPDQVVDAVFRGLEANQFIPSLIRCKIVCNYVLKLVASSGDNFIFTCVWSEIISLQICFNYHEDNCPVFN